MARWYAICNTLFAQCIGGCNRHHAARFGAFSGRGCPKFGWSVPELEARAQV
jgi:hypothetical protein